MADPRLNYLLLFIGTLGTGKTTSALKLARATGKKIIVIDRVRHPAYNDWETISAEGLKTWNGKECRHIYENLKDTLEILSKYQNNCCIMFEDCGPDWGGNLSRFQEYFIVDHRKYDFDLILMYHFLSEVSPYVCKQYTKIVLLKTGDDLTTKQSKWPNWFTIQKKALKLKNNKDFHACEVISRYE